MSSLHRLIVAAALQAAVATPALAEAPPDDQRLDAVTVYGRGVREALEAQRDLTPGGVSLVDGEELTIRRVQTLADSLRYVPGLWAQSASGADDVFFSSRGSNLDATNYDGNGIRLLQDGLSVTTADGNNHNRVIDPLSARDIVVARGANAMAYGASTLGGAIDFSSRTALDSPRVSLLANAGQFGQANARLTAGGVSGPLDGLVTVEGRHWDGYRDHAGQRRRGVYANVGWQLGEVASTRLFATWVHNDQQLPGALTAAEAASDPRQASPFATDAEYGKKVETWRVADIVRFDLGDAGKLSAGAAYERQTLYHPIVERILVDFDGPGPAPPVEVFSLLIDTAHRDVGTMVRYEVTRGDHTLLAGLNYGDGSVRGGNWRNLGGRRNGLTERVAQDADSLEAYAVDHWRFGNGLVAVIGAQFAHASREVRVTTVASGAVRDPRARYSQFNPRVGLIREFGNGSQLFASASRVFEPPTTFELVDDVRGANTALDPMHGTVVEIGFRGNAGEWMPTYWELSLYRAAIRDEILSVEDPAAPGTSLATNIERTTHAGLEALIGTSLPVGPALRLEPRVSVTLNDFTFDSDRVYGGNALPAAPRYAIQGELTLRHASGGYVGPTFDLVGRRFADFSNTYRVGSYGLVGLRAGYDAGPWQAYVDLRNGLDRRHISSFTVLDRAAGDARILNTGSPRAVSAGVRFDW